MDRKLINAVASSRRGRDWLHRSDDESKLSNGWLQRRRRRRVLVVNDRPPWMGWRSIHGGKEGGLWNALRNNEARNGWMTCRRPRRCCCRCIVLFAAFRNWWWLIDSGWWFGRGHPPNHRPSIVTRILLDVACVQQQQITTRTTRDSSSPLLPACLRALLSRYGKAKSLT